MEKIFPAERQGSIELVASMIEASQAASLWIKTMTTSQILLLRTQPIALISILNFLSIYNSRKKSKG